MRTRKTASTLTCGVAAALDVVGDTWSMLIMRDVFSGIDRFDALQKSLGIASNILAQRLRKLEDEGILERRDYHEVPPRVEYAPTAKGRGLYPVLLTLKQWGDRWSLPAGEPRPYRYVHQPCGHETSPRTVCEHCREPLSSANVRREHVARAARRPA